MKTLTLLLLLLTSASALSEEAPQSGAAPAWFLEEVATLAAGSGRWITDNSAYQSEQEPYEAYATEWLAPFDGTTLSGRLFGFVDGKETGNFWEFRIYWHPERKQAVVEQFGWRGTVGLGTMWREGATTKSDQTFYSTDGGASRTGHISHFPDASTHVTESFDIDGDAWTPRRSYTWRLAPPGTDSAGD